MTATTTYSIHDARDHSIVATANPGTLTEVAKQVGVDFADQGTRRFYVHNGVGVVAAILCRDGSAHETLRDNYRKFDESAKAVRAAKGIVE